MQLAAEAEVSKQRQLLVEEPYGQPIEGNEAFPQIVMTEREIS